MPRRTGSNTTTAPKANVVRGRDRTGTGAAAAAAATAKSPAPAKAAAAAAVAAAPAPARSVSTTGMALSTPNSPAANLPKQSEKNRFRDSVNARWAGEETAEAELREHFLNLPTDDAIHLLNRMRTNCEIAAKAINEAIEKNKKEDRCYVCNGPKPPNKQWAFVKAVKQPVTNIMVNIFFCSTACVSRENIKNQGPAGANHLR